MMYDMIWCIIWYDVWYMIGEIEGLTEHQQTKLYPLTNFKQFFRLSASLIGKWLCFDIAVIHDDDDVNDVNDDSDGDHGWWW